MLINNKDLSEYGAEVKQWRFDLESQSWKNESEWVSGAALPIFQNNVVGFKDFTVTLMVYGISREDIKQRASNILADLLVPVEIEMDGWTHKFRGVLEKSKMKEFNDFSRNRFQTLELEFTGYEHGDEESVSVSAATSGDELTITITNPGNIVSPAIIELTPTIGDDSVTITGICRDSSTGEDLPVTVDTLTTGNTVILDGTTGLITEDGEQKGGDVDMWALPTLLPGENTITVSTIYMDVTVRVLPMYM